jgi:hypothetical protein
LPLPVSKSNLKNLLCTSAKPCFHDVLLEYDDRCCDYSQNYFFVVVESWLWSRYVVLILCALFFFSFNQFVSCVLFLHWIEGVR